MTPSALGDCPIMRCAAHGFLFQHHAEFAADVDGLLTASS
jgi:hypothetical protein